jgi:coenzyme F420-reducing hydrogenase alpha subunit
MSFALGAGAIRIDVTVSRAQVCAVEITATRPQGLARMFIGRRPEEAPILAGQLFSLCGFAQSLAARLAVLRAASDSMSNAERRLSAMGLLAERVFETLRSLVLHWPSPAIAGRAAASAPLLREALAASQEIIAKVRSNNSQAGTFASPAARLKDAALALGIAADNTQPAAGTLCAAMLAEARHDRIFRPRRPDALSSADDAAVIDHLRHSPGYAALPFLSGRVVETGAYARLCRSAEAGEPFMAARLLARIADVRSCLDSLQRLTSGAEHDAVSLMTDGPVAGAGGYGAVECARGRLFHQAEIGEDGQISAYRILAPTEWNFHPAGPFVETLLSCRIGTGEAARNVVSRLAALYDPCVAFEIDVCEVVHA